MTRGDRIGAFLLTEPHAGSDTAAFRTTARRDGDHFVLNGTKQFISNGSEAGTVIVVARTDPEAGKHGFTTFIVDPAMPGYSVARVEQSSASAPLTSRKFSLRICVSRPRMLWARSAAATVS